MGIFSKLFGEKETIYIEGDGGFDLEVVGESHYQRHLKKLCGGYSKEGSKTEVVAKLIFENKNPHDNQAIRVDVEGKTVGYLSREDARLYRKRVRKTGHDGITMLCNGKIFGGKKLGLLSKTNFGVWLDLPIEKLFDPSWEEEEEEEGEHYTDYVESVRQLKSEGKFEEALTLLNKLMQETENEAKDFGAGYGVAPWYYEQAAIMFRKLKLYEREVEVLERYERQPKAPGVGPKKLAQRLIKAREIVNKNRA